MSKELAGRVVYVLCLNDWPIGVYASEELANQARERDSKFRESRFGTAIRHYHVHGFSIGAE